MHHLICIHGIGSHSTNWVNQDRDYTGLTFQEFLNKQFELLYPEKTKGDKNLSSYLTLHSINYDNEIRKILSNWDQEFNKLVSGMDATPGLSQNVDWYSDFVSSIEKRKEDQHFTYTHLADLLFFYGSPTFQARLRTHVSRQILEILESINVVKDKSVSVSILGHSMGTAMLDKSVKDAFHQPVQSIFEGKKDTLFGHFSFHTIIQIANCSRTLSRKVGDSFYDTALKPSLDSRAYSRLMINLNHKYDPVGRFLPVDFSHEGWIDPAVKARDYVSDILITEITSKEIHSLQHYFSNPQAIIKLFHFLIGDKAKDSKINKYTAEFKEKSLQTQSVELAVRFKEISVNDFDSFRDFVKSVSSYIKLLESYGEQQ